MSISASSINYSEVIDYNILIKVKADPTNGFYKSFVCFPVYLEFEDDADLLLKLHGGITYGPEEEKINGKDYIVYGNEYRMEGESADTIEALKYDKQNNLNPDFIWTLKDVIKNMKFYIRIFLDYIEEYYFKKILDDSQVAELFERIASEKQKTHSNNPPQ